MMPPGLNGLLAPVVTPGALFSRARSCAYRDLAHRLFEAAGTEDPVKHSGSRRARRSRNSEKTTRSRSVSNPFGASRPSLFVISEATRLQRSLVFPSRLARCRSRERVKKRLGDTVQDRLLQRLDHVANETLDSGSRFGGHGIHSRGAGAPLFRATIQWART
jgi:hypothetical protein